MRLAILATVAASCAGAAYAQDDACRNGPSDKARPEFVHPYTAALAALTARDWSLALTNAVQAKPYASSGQQVAAVMQVEVAVIAETEDRPTFIAAMETALGMPCLPELARASYRQKLAELRG